MLTLDLLNKFVNLDKYGKEYSITKNREMEYASGFLMEKIDRIREEVKSELYDEQAKGIYLCGIDLFFIKYGFQIVTFCHNDYDQVLEFAKTIDQVTQHICITIWGNLRDKPNGKKTADELYCNKPEISNLLYPKE